MPWLGWTCGECRYCRSGRENLCDRARFTGYHLDGGYAEYAVADERFCFPIPAGYPDLEAAPLLCAGLIGYRALRMAGDAERLGLYGFGASAHIVAQVARHQGRRVFAFTRAGRRRRRRSSRASSARTGPADSDERPPEELDAAIIFAPVGRARPGGAARRREGRHRRLRRHPHERHPVASPTSSSGASAWCARSRTSRARDGEEFLALAPRVPVRTEVETYPLAGRTRRSSGSARGRLRGAAVLTIG